ncbi:Protein white [Portunus trituberculatus]|uniref:Protein white n=1 Tax=Portunus trituberculatus TaxID=210409 RepID=A0A5B7IEP1_PORTR|nr:Protein white [Portunus trituberculatus]
MHETCGTMRETSTTSCYDMVRRLTIARSRTKFSKILENLVRTVTISLPWYTAWLKYISWFMYTNEALTVTQWKDIKNISKQRYL